MSKPIPFAYAGHYWDKPIFTPFHFPYLHNPRSKLRYWMASEMCSA